MFVGYIEDHPRSRGVHLHPFLLPPFCLGSSFLFRIIPARAGSTALLFICFFATKDHPRSRGVHYFARYDKPYCGGSSPLARGPPLLHLRVIVLIGIIPARAGSTGILDGLTEGVEDHPRSRGVHNSLTTSGSSVCCKLIIPGIGNKNP